MQTPVRGPAADQLRTGDRVWLRHAKAGELAERFRDYHVLHETDSSAPCPRTGARASVSAEVLIAGI